MKLKEKIKRFLALDVHGHEGFTLVELIIVIAILAILSSVAVVGYSSYIKKANMQADKTLVAEIANALTLHYYSNIESATSDYIILSADGKAVAGGEFAAAALVAAYGENWEDALKLKYDGWTINSALLKAALGAANPGALGVSSYLENSNVSDLLGNVQLVTGAASELLGTVAKTPEQYSNALVNNMGPYYTELAVNAGLMTENEDGTYTLVGATQGEDGDVVVSEDLQTQLSNLMVLSVAKELETASEDDMMGLMIGDTSECTGTYSVGAQLAAQYALFKAVTLSSGSKEMQKDFDALNETMTTSTSTSVVAAAFADFNSKYETAINSYALAENDISDQFANDANALISIMGGVTAVSPNYSDAETLKNSELYTSGAIANDLNAYIAASSLAAGLTDAQLQQLIALNLTDGILICISANGEVYAIYN